MEKIRIQNDLFKLIGVKDGDPRYADCLLISNYVQQEIAKAVKLADLKARRDELVWTTGAELSQQDLQVFRSRMNKLDVQIEAEELSLKEHKEE